MLRLHTLAYTFAFATLFAGSAHAFDSGNVMNCKLEGGGFVQLNAEDGQTTLVLDRAARSALVPETSATLRISSEAQLAHVAKDQGYGHFFSMLELEGDLGTKSCQAWIQFQVEPGQGAKSVQKFAANNVIPLSAQADQSFIRCANHRARIQSCTAGLDLVSMSDLGHFFHAEEGFKAPAVGSSESPVADTGSRFARAGTASESP